MTINSIIGPQQTQFNLTRTQRVMVEKKSQCWLLKITFRNRKGWTYETEKTIGTPDEEIIKRILEHFSRQGKREIIKHHLTGPFETESIDIYF